VGFTGSEIQIEGYSNTLDMQSVTLTFAVASDAVIEGANPVSLPNVPQLFADLYRARLTGSGAATQSAGSSFLLRIPVNFEGDAGVVASVAVAMTNAAGMTQSQPQPRN